jgi:hypothetical protein
MLVVRRRNWLGQQALTPKSLVTCICAELLKCWYLAVIVADPGVAPVTRPPGVTVAEFDAEDHVAFAVTSVVDPSAFVKTALSCCAPPT